jgi:Bacterial Ig-like domain (group 2)
MKLQALQLRVAALLSIALLLASVGCSSSSNNSSGGGGGNPAVTAIAVSPTSASVNVGSTTQFTARATYSDGSTKDVTSSSTWSSSNSAVASVESTGQASPGLATGVSGGSSTIGAAFSGHNGSTTLTVNGSTGVVTSILLSPTSITMSVSGTQQFTATAGYSDGSSKNVTSLATWSSTDSTVASIQSTGQTSPGLAAGVAPGNVNITATYSGVSAVTTVNVISTTGKLTGFTIAQIAPSIAPGSTLQLFGYASYSDGSAQWVTDSTTWSSSNTTAASIQNQGQTSPGLVTAGNGSGTTTITGSYGGLQQTTKLSVAANALPIDLMDMSASDNYLHFPGGLYENSSNTLPSDHDAAGKAAAAAIQPLDQNGNPNSKGAIVFVGIGMSNATEEFSAFVSTAKNTTGVNHTTLAIEDGALGAATACYWTVAQGQTGTACPQAAGTLLNNQYDRVRDTVLAADIKAPSAPSGCGVPPNPVPCLTEKQVQVLWIKNANPRPAISNWRLLCDATVSGCVNDLGTEAINYESQLGKIIRAAKSRYPNLQQIFLSTRIYAGYATDGLNPEPYAYEYGYSAKWLIEAEVQQMRPSGPVDPVAGDLSYTNGSAAWTAWGTYLWADGTTPRVDGLVWQASDFQADGTHPGPTGVTKVVNLLMTFYLSSPYTPWFRP